MASIWKTCMVLRKQAEDLESNLQYVRKSWETFSSTCDQKAKTCFVYEPKYIPDRSGQLHIFRKANAFVQ